MTACTETSRDEVTSSQTSSRGSTINARAMATRWRCPPESSCGNRGLTEAVRETLASAPERERARRAKLSRVAKKRGLGGYERGSGRGKKGWYRGFWCDSTYELAFVVWALDHEIPFERNLEFFSYEYQGRVYRWTPDFRLGDGSYIEIKGYLTDQSRAKLEYFYRSLQVLTRADLNRMFEYVHGRYGKNLLALYDLECLWPGRVAEPGLLRQS